MITIARARKRDGSIGKPKNGKARTIAFLPPARVLDDLPRRPDPYVFHSARGNPLVQGSHHYAWRAVRAAAGLDVRWHDLRHFTATQLLEMGMSHFDVSVQLGHEDGGALVMARYGHPSTDRARERLLAPRSASRAPKVVAALVAALELVRMAKPHGGLLDHISRFRKGPPSGPFFFQPARSGLATLVPPGASAEWLRSGLQSRLHRFDSGRRLPRSSFAILAEYLKLDRPGLYAHVAIAYHVADDADFKSLQALVARALSRVPVITGTQLRELIGPERCARYEIEQEEA